jgi:hypothetical protein
MASNDVIANVPVVLAIRNTGVSKIANLGFNRQDVARGPKSEEFGAADSRGISYEILSLDRYLLFKTIR